jgi:YD repeat-containing protein
MGQIIQVENGDPASLSVMNYIYDGAGRIRHIDDTNGNRTTRTYDLRDNLRTLIDPDRGVMKYRYDSWGAMVWQQNAKLEETQYDYDKLGRLTEQSATDYIETRSYDTQANGEGKLAQVSYSKPGEPVHHQQTPSYDELGRLTQRIECLGAEGEGCSDYTTTYGYDSYSRLQLTTLPDGKEVYREYNNNILHRLRRGENGALIWQMNNMDARGRPKRETAGNGVSTHYTYDYTNDKNGHLTNVRVNDGASDLMSRDYKYDPDNAQLESREDLLFD